MDKNLKLVLTVLIVLLSILYIIIKASSVLKEEALNNYLTISKLNAKSFSKEINQDLINLELSINNIKPIISYSSIHPNINSKLIEIQRYYPQIRSINILKDSKIVYSSNKENINLKLENLNLFPNPIFDDHILKVSTPWIGRDFISGKDLYNYKEKVDEKELFFLPLSKSIVAKDGFYNVIINLNIDYYLTRFLEDIHSNGINFELTRLDGITLYSTNKNEIGKKVDNKNLLEKAILRNELSSIEIINGNRYFVSFILIDDFPISLNVKLDYEESLSSWNSKQYNFFIITTITLIATLIIATILFRLYNRGKQNEIKLHKKRLEEHEKFKLLFETSDFLAAVLDEDGRILEINHSALSFLHKATFEVLDIYFWNLPCWEEKERKILKDIFQDKQKEKKVELELKAKTHDDQYAIIYFNLSTIHKEKVFNYIAFSQNITQRKEEERKLKQSYAVFNNTKDGIMITDKYTKIIDVNKAFENITGYKKEEILHKTTSILKSDKHDTNFYRQMWKSIKENGFWEGEIINISQDKRYYTEWLTINTIYDENKKVLNYIGIFSDITEQKSKDQILYQQSKMASMGEMIENIAHQWRQPLSIISTASTGLKLEKELGFINEKEELERLDLINESAQFLSDTIEDFRKYLNNKNDIKVFDVSDTVLYALKLTSSKLKNKNLEVITNLESLELNSVKNEFVQVLINIINNAKDAHDNSGVENKYIFINTYEKDENIVIEIKDNAGGIEDDVLNFIFDPYFTTKHKSQGTGIGLYMSSKIVQNHMHGSLSASTQKYTYLDQDYTGACFTISIPK